MKPSQERWHFYAGATGGFAEYFTYSVRGYTRQWKDMLVYYNPEGGSRFQVVYDSLAQETGLEASVQFNLKDKVKIGTRGTFRQFKMSTVPFNYAVPNTRVDFWASYNFADKLTLSSEVYVFGSRTMTVDSLMNPITQSAMADVNFSADYRFSKRLSVFLELNNILSNKFYRWYNYQERPFDVRAGATFSF